ncbi:hypothetical protein WN944_005419 [Citrus x changshan-huyou]|uniref:Uncharacterized protein n=1 Tax=Citrus x changshan-huyou TaxID=2935761 RepID=A0AAP0QH58_9ROSI
MAETIEKKGKALDAIVDQIPSSCVHGRDARASPVNMKDEFAEIPHNFMKQMKGCHKGDEVKGIHELKYENSKGNNQSTHANDDDFDELLGICHQN